MLTPRMFMIDGWSGWGIDEYVQSTDEYINTYAFWDDDDVHSSHKYLCARKGGKTVH